MDEQSPIPFKQYFPNLSLSSYFWLAIGVSSVVFCIGGYFIGARVSGLSASSSQPTQSQTSSTSPSGNDNDTAFAEVFGTFTTDTSYYDQLDVYVDSIKNGVRTNQDVDYRYIVKPQVGVAYPFSFQRLDPTKEYIFSASACITNPKTYALICAKHINITKCSGTIQGANCIIKAPGPLLQTSGAVDFSLKKVDNPVPTISL